MEEDSPVNKIGKHVKLKLDSFIYFQLPSQYNFTLKSFAMVLHLTLCLNVNNSEGIGQTAS